MKKFLLIVIALVAALVVFRDPIVSTAVSLGGER